MSAAYAWAESDPGDEWSLTTREREVLLAVGRRLSNTEIAEEFTLSKRTVECYISSLYVKIGAADRRELRQAADHLRAAGWPHPAATSRALHPVPRPSSRRGAPAGAGEARPDAAQASARDPEFWQHFIDIVGHRVSHNRLTVESTRLRAAEQARRRQQRHASRAELMASVG